MNKNSDPLNPLGGEHPLISVERARFAALAGVLSITGSERIPLAASLGRVVDENVNTSIPLPPFDQSAMDGYAVRTQEVLNVPLSRIVAGRIAAGQYPDGLIYPQNTVVRILTGAAVPSGFDAVVMQELCHRDGESVTINHRPMAGENIRGTGDDIHAGDRLVENGTLIDPRHIAIMAASGVGLLKVRRKINVGLISTGNEISDSTESLWPGGIHDSNKPMLAAMLTRPGIVLHDLGHVIDNADVMAEAFASAAGSVDVLLSTGGISVGEEDHVQAAIAARGGYVDPLRAGLKPGKPAAIGRLGDTVLLALPGNPLSALVTFLWFARPVIEKRMGMTPVMPLAVRAQSSFGERRRPGRDEFVPVSVKRESDGGLTVTKLGRGGSSRLAPLLSADGLARIAGHLESIEPGDALDVYLFNSAFAL